MAGRWGVTVLTMGVWLACAAGAGAQEAAPDGAAVAAAAALLPLPGAPPFADAVGDEGGGGGGFFDWIHKLSGPAFVGGRASLFYQFGSSVREKPGLRIRADVALRTAVNKEGKVEPEATSISMQSYQLRLEVPAADYPFYFGTGIALHRFTSDDFAEAVTTYSVPASLGWRHPTGFLAAGLRLVPLVEATLHYWPAFEDDDFAPVDVSVSRDDSEAVLQFVAGFDVRW